MRFGVGDAGVSSTQLRKAAELGRVQKRRAQSAALKLVPFVEGSEGAIVRSLPIPDLAKREQELDPFLRGHLRGLRHLLHARDVTRGKRLRVHGREPDIASRSVRPTVDQLPEEN